MPEGPSYPAATWWQALAVLVYMTGWRIGQCLALRPDEFDAAAGTVLASRRAVGNKGKRDALIPLHPLAVEHLEKLTGLSERLFPWPHHRRTLDEEWHWI
jgi:integrase